MTASTELIVLSKSNYSESSIVVQCYAKNYGKVALLVTGVKKKKAKVKSALFEPLSILEVHGNFEKGGLVIPKEVKVVMPLLHIQSSMIKRSLALFISEVLYKALYEALPDEDAFDFLTWNLSYLNTATHSVATFHIVFLLRFTRFLGFQPQVNPGQYLDISDGLFTDAITPNAVLFSAEQKAIITLIFGSKIDKAHQINLTVADRKFFIDLVLMYYRVHIPGMGQIKSHEILEEIFH
jgi:DNA repair protein RecO (recombination protein O)